MAGGSFKQRSQHGHLSDHKKEIGHPRGILKTRSAKLESVGPDPVVVQTVVLLGFGGVGLGLLVSLLFCAL